MSKPNLSAILRGLVLVVLLYVGCAGLVLLMHRSDSPLNLTIQVVNSTSKRVVVSVECEAAILKNPPQLLVEPGGSRLQEIGLRKTTRESACRFRVNSNGTLGNLLLSTHTHVDDFSSADSPMRIQIQQNKVQVENVPPDSVWSEHPQ
jgi:hypothetical protein